MTRAANAGLCRNLTIKMLRKQQDAAQCQVVEKQCLRCLPSDPNVRKDYLYFLRSYRPRQKELGPLFTSFYHRFVYKQGTIRRRISRKTKRRCCANYIGSDSNVTTHKRVTVFITWSLLLCLLLQIFWYVLICTDMICMSIYAFLTQITAASIYEGCRLSNICKC